MVVQWVFSRGDERADIDIVRTDEYYVVHVREPKGECWTTAATAIDAILQQADVERRLMWGGWYLADFVCAGGPGQTCSPLGSAWRAGDALPLAALSASKRETPLTPGAHTHAERPTT
jgi:hypothetical protein